MSILLAVYDVFVSVTYSFTYSSPARHVYGTDVVRKVAKTIKYNSEIFEVIIISTARRFESSRHGGRTARPSVSQRSLVRPLSIQHHGS